MKPVELLPNEPPLVERACLRADGGCGARAGEPCVSKDGPSPGARLRYFHAARRRGPVTEVE